MAIDILSLKPNVISRDLRGKYVMFYGKEKCGKTTAAAQFPKPILLAFERGYNAISGVIAQDITKWSDAKLVLRQLEKSEAKEKFQTVIFDTVPIMWDLIEQYICAQNGVSKISEIPWGQGYTACRKELETTLRRVSQMGYSVVLIAHSTSRIEKAADGSEIEILAPDLPKRAAAICNAMVDLIGYIGVEYVDGVSKRWLYTRETPTLFAGNRFKYMSPKIPFGYNELVKAIGEAIDKAEQLDGATVTNESGTLVTPEPERLDFNALMSEAREIWTSLVAKAQTDEEKADIVRAMSKKVEMVFGRKIKLSEVTEDQVDLLALALMDLRELAKQN